MKNLYDIFHLTPPPWKHDFGIVFECSDTEYAWLAECKRCHKLIRYVSYFHYSDVLRKIATIGNDCVIPPPLEKSLADLALELRQGTDHDVYMAKIVDVYLNIKADRGFNRWVALHMLPVHSIVASLGCKGK